MKKISNLIFSLIVIITVGSCSSEPNIPDYQLSRPSSITGLRRVQLKPDLQFGHTEIVAVVTSDIAQKNIDEHTVIVQDKVGDAAIVLELSEPNQSLFLGDEVLIDLIATQLIERNGELVVTGLPITQIVKTGNSVQITPKSTNIASLSSNAAYWGPIVVKLEKIFIHNEYGNNLSGKLSIDDEIISVYSDFLETSIFVDEDNPEFVEAFIGIVRMKNSDIYVNPRNLDDIQVGLLQLIEDFEQDTSTNYDKKVLNFVTGMWTIDGGITAATSADPKNGAQSIRLQGNISNQVRQGIISMEFDLVGVKSISVSHGIYPANAEVNNVNPTIFDIEVSYDKGETYSLVGTVEVDTSSRELSTSSFTIDAGFSENVRFRIVNSSIPFTNGNRPRINIDDFVFNF